MAHHRPDMQTSTQTPHQKRHRSSSAAHQHKPPLDILQQNIGNAATQRTLSENTSVPSDLHQTMTALQPVVGNARVLRMSQRRASVAVIQRRLRIKKEDLAGKQAASTFGKLVDNSHTSTFRAIEKALDEYHKTEDYDPKLEGILHNIVDKCREWLKDPQHKGAADAQKRDSLTNLEVEAQYEYRRLVISRELGVTHRLVDSFDKPIIDAFWAVVLAFQTGDVKGAMGLFRPLKAHLGDGAELIESFMKRNQVAKINPQLAESMNSSKFEMKSASGSQDAIQLIKNQAQGKIDRLATLNANLQRDQAQYTADAGDLKNRGQKPPTFDDLPADKKALYTKIEDKGYQPDAMKILHYPLLQPGTSEAVEHAKLKLEEPHYRAIISGKAVQDKKAEKGYKDFTETELYGVMGYTSNLYGAINSPLRFDVGDDSKFTAGHMALAGSITSALYKLKPFKGDVYRHGGDFKGYSSVNVPGATVSDMAPLSTAIDQKGPANAAEQHEVLEVLTSVAGRDVSKMSMFGNKEGEVLFAPGTRFRVVATFERNGAFWGKEHKLEQWTIRDQHKDPYFKKAMELVEKDGKKNEFHRVVIKTEVS